MSKVDINDAIRGIVADEVEKSLAPYREMIGRMAAFMGIQAPGAGSRPARPAVREAPARQRATRRPGRRAAAAQGKGDVNRFHEGQTVHYRQGRGEFEAKILKIDPARSMLTIERTSDSKVVERPAAKVYEVA